MNIKEILNAEVETYDLPVTLDGLVDILDFNKYCLSDDHVTQLENIVNELR